MPEEQEVLSAAPEIKARSPLAAQAEAMLAGLQVGQTGQAGQTGSLTAAFEPADGAATVPTTPKAEPKPPVAGEPEAERETVVPKVPDEQTLAERVKVIRSLDTARSRVEEARAKLDALAPMQQRIGATKEGDSDEIRPASDTEILIARRELIGAEFDLEYAELTVPWQNQSSDDMRLAVEDIELDIEDKMAESAAMQAQGREKRANAMLAETADLRTGIELIERSLRLREAVEAGNTIADQSAKGAVDGRYLKADEEKVRLLHESGAEPWQIQKQVAENSRPYSERDGYEKELATEVEVQRAAIYEGIRAQRQGEGLVSNLQEQVYEAPTDGTTPDFGRMTDKEVKSWLQKALREKGLMP